jgi:HNH endonuclease/Helix-turn-helix domain
MGKQTIEQRRAIFWRRVDTRGADDCWDWTGPLNRYGYGSTTWKNRGHNASRLAWILTHGDPGDMVVCHTCDRPICCNPSHLFLGTQGDNVRDCNRKGRGKGQFSDGASAPHPRYTAKLNPALVSQAKNLYASGVSQTEIGRRLGVHSSTISRAVRGEQWAHIP